MFALSLLLGLGCVQELPAGAEHAFEAQRDDQRIAFAVLGDAGTGAPNQTQVAAGLESVCDARAADDAALDCELVLYLGDNVYEHGVNGVDDRRFKERFEEPYANVDLPFFVVGGNHDYGVHGYGFPVVWETQKLRTQIDYSDHSDKWTFPGRYWVARETSGLLSFIGLDSTALVWTQDQAQREWVSQQLAEDASSWRFVFLHHTLLSNGRHGNAGRYPAIEDESGDRLQSLWEQTVCGQVDAAFTGHDHTLQWITSRCGSEVFVSGAAGKSSSLRDADERHNAAVSDGVGVRYALGKAEDGSYQLGFLVVELEPERLTGVFYDADGGELYRETIER